MKSLQLQAQGAEVRILQELLNLHGISVLVDGQFGRKTQKAVITFQREYTTSNNKSLVANGYVENQTWWALVFHTPKSATIQEIKIDSITVKRIQTAHPDLREELHHIYRQIVALEIPVRFTAVYRSIHEQNQLYIQGRNGIPGEIITHAMGGESYHNYGLAVDFCLLTNKGTQATWNRNTDFNQNQQKDWLEVVNLFIQHGWEWGGNWESFKDYPHFQKTFGFTTGQLMNRINLHQTVENQYPLLT